MGRRAPVPANARPTPGSASSRSTSRAPARPRVSVEPRCSGLIDECERRGLWKLVSRVFPENEASLALCRSLGFRDVGVYRRHAKLDGEWRDVVIVERLLGDAS